ncbi:MAG: hypothetical protein H0Z39_03740 [Peptococcaceae bacterium]|nr:hypothetical protein [Peptococcaceae bacterium]
MLDRIYHHRFREYFYSFGFAFIIIQSLAGPELVYRSCGGIKRELSIAALPLVYPFARLLVYLVPDPRSLRGR